MEDVHTGARVCELRERVDGVCHEPVRIRSERACPVQEIVAADGGQAVPVEALMGPRESLRPFARAMGREGV